MAKVLQTTLSGVATQVLNAFYSVRKASDRSLVQTGNDLTIATGGALEINVDAQPVNVGDEMIVHFDNYNGSNASSYKSASKVIAVTDTAPPPSNYSNIVFVGTSKFQSMFGRDLVTPHAASTAALAAEGVAGVNVYGYGWAGNYMSNLLIRIQEAFDAFPTDTLFIVEAGANDVHLNRPRATMTAQEVIDFQADIDATFALLGTRSADVIPLPITFVTYDDPQTSDEAFFNDAFGVKPFNDEFFLPKIQANHAFSLNTDNYSLIDTYNFVRNNYAQMMSADGIHPTGDGYTVLSDFMIKRTASFLKAESIGVIVPAPTVDNGNKMYVSLGSLDKNVDSLNAFNMEFIGGSATIKASLVDFNGNTAKPRLLPVTGWFTNSANTGVLTNALDFDGTTLFAIQVLSDSAFNSSTQTHTFTLDRLDANANYQLEFIGSRSSATYRETLIQSGAQSVILQTSADPAQQPQGFTVQSDANGQITFTQSSNNAQNIYLNGFSLQKV